MAGRNKRHAVTFLRAFEQEIRTSERANELWGQRQRYRSWDDVGDEVHRRLSHMRVSWAGLLDGIVIGPHNECDFHRIIKRIGEGSPRDRPTGTVRFRFDYRGNRIDADVDGRAFYMAPEHTVGWIADRGRMLDSLPCAHPRDRLKRHFRDVEPTPLIASAIAEFAVTTAALETYVRCEDCGEAVDCG